MSCNDAIKKVSAGAPLLAVKENSVNHLEHVPEVIANFAKMRDFSEMRADQGETATQKVENGRRAVQLHDDFPAWIADLDIAYLVDQFQNCLIENLFGLAF